MARTRMPANEPKEIPIGAGTDGLPMTQCRMCQSTRRAPYTETSKMEHDGTLIRWLRTKCLDCGQTRIDRIEGKQPTEQDQ